VVKVAASEFRSGGGPLEIDRATIPQLGARGVDVDATDIRYGSVRARTRGRFGLLCDRRQRAKAITASATGLGAPSG
jgi:hypothetical protein